jgi:hypothetical protein
MSVKSFLAVCAVTAAGTIPAIDALETKGVISNRLSPLSSEIVGGCVIETASGRSSLAIEKTQYLLSSGYNLVASASGDNALTRDEISRQFAWSDANHDDTKRTIDLVKKSCDAAEREGITIRNSTHRLKVKGPNV